MSQAKDAAATSSKPKRIYRRGSPLSPVERQLNHISRKKLTHKELRLYVENQVKDDLKRLCAEHGLNQSEMIELLIRKAINEI
ncbi:TPA: replication regulatory protein RepA [Escherichia coli]|nr:replication regulatory protein RepA [Escherichia coli]HAV9253292.1 replication regulatory protein RepA [Escherichia coli]HAW0316517.1 replication regulatory protein RepA [Escherichia coli]HAW1122908.1 replication regulatory protein RepA [Escherichia coli]HCH7642663.1 replication regulatory protein RepA [Escherichia coli]